MGCNLSVQSRARPPASGQSVLAVHCRAACMAARATCLLADTLSTASATDAPRRTGGGGRGGNLCGRGGGNDVAAEMTSFSTSSATMLLLKWFQRLEESSSAVAHPGPWRRRPRRWQWRNIITIRRSAVAKKTVPVIRGELPWEPPLRAPRPRARRPALGLGLGVRLRRSSRRGDRRRREMLWASGSGSRRGDGPPPPTNMPRHMRRELPGASGSWRGDRCPRLGLFRVDPVPVSRCLRLCGPRGAEAGSLLGCVPSGRDALGLLLGRVPSRRDRFALLGCVPSRWYPMLTALGWSRRGVNSPMITSRRTGCCVMGRSGGTWSKNVPPIPRSPPCICGSNVCGGPS